MRLENIDLNLFKVFDALYRERSVTKAAIVLNLTQPAISNILNRLRKTFDDPLFVRSPEGMAPTPVADSMVGDIREALTLLRRSVGVNARFSPQTSEKIFHLGMNDLAEALLLPGLRQLIKASAPKISITSYYVTRETAVEDLKAGTLDLLVDAPYLNSRDLNHQFLASLPYVVAMRPDHPLRERQLSVEDYLAAEHLHVSSRRRGSGQMDVALHKLGYRRRVMMRIQNYLVAARITAETDLLWTTPGVLVDSLPLSVRALPFAVEPMEWNLYWHRNADSDPATVWMREIIGTVAAQTLGEQTPAQGQPT